MDKLTRKHPRSWSTHQIAQAQKHLAAEVKRRESRRSLARARAIVICKRFGLQPAELARLITARGPDKGPRKAYTRRASTAQKPQRGVRGPAKKGGKPTVIAPAAGGGKKKDSRANGLAAALH